MLRIDLWVIPWSDEDGNVSMLGPFYSEADAIKDYNKLMEDFSVEDAKIEHIRVPL